MKKFIPIFVIAGANVLYHISAKGTNPDINPFVSLIVTYLLAIAFCAIYFYISSIKSESRNLFKEMRKANWATFVLGFCLAGLEFGNIMMYKAGWNISVGSISCAIALSLVLLAIGVIYYKDKMTVSKLAGICLCIGGIILLNI